MEQRFAAEGTARFFRIQDAENALYEFKKWVKEKHSTGGKFWIHDIQYDQGTQIDYKICPTETSEPLQNCRNQCEKIKEFFKTQEGLMVVKHKVFISIVNEESVFISSAE
jgi:hypothetical protein